MLEPTQDQEPDVRSRLIQVLVEKTGVDAATVTDETRFNKIANIPTRVKLLTAINEEFGLNLSLSQATKFPTVGAAVEALEAHLKNN